VQAIIYGCSRKKTPDESIWSDGASTGSNGAGVAALRLWRLILAHPERTVAEPR
jgi:hypothetical protein